MSSETRPRVRQLAIVALVVLAVLTVAVRLFGAWCYRHGLNLDHAVLSLMTQHMAEGREFPLFFYGQSYLGTLEPMVSAVCGRVFGISGFTVCLGTALVGMLLSVLVFLWGRRTGGFLAGFLAAAYLVVGPKGSFHYLGSPRCYALVMCLCVGLLWLAAETVERTHRRGRVSIADLFGLGLLAGIGWWSHALAMTGVGTAGVVLLVLLHRRLLDWRVLTALPGFLLGSAPWWVWNVQHQFRSLRATNSLETDHAMRHLGYFWGDRMLRILQLNQLPQGLMWAGVTVYLVAYVVVLVLLIRSWRRRDVAPVRQAALLGLALFLPVSSVFYSITEFGRFDTARYHLPLVPAWALMLGVAVAAASRYRRWAGAVAAVAVLSIIAGHGVNVPRALEMTRRNEETHAAGETVVAFCREHQLEAVIADHARRWMSFTSRGRPPFVPLDGLRYRPFGEAQEAATRLGILNGVMYAPEFLAASGGSAAVEHMGENSIMYDFTPPQGGLAPCPADAIATITNAAGGDYVAMLSDRERDTAWVPAFAHDIEGITVTFARPVPLRAVRLVFAHDGHPSRWRMLGRREGAADWHTLMPLRVITPYHWSGPRPFAGGASWRLEGRLDDTPLEALRLEFRHRRSRRSWAVSELSLYVPGDTAMATPTDLAELRTILAARGIERLYADRWVSTRLRYDEGGDVWTLPQAFLFRSDRERFDPAVSWSPATGLLVPRHEAPSLERVLSAAGVLAQPHPVGPWMLFAYVPGTGVPVRRIEWMGWGAFLGAP